MCYNSEDDFRHPDTIKQTESRRTSPINPEGLWRLCLSKTQCIDPLNFRDKNIR